MIIKLLFWDDFLIFLKELSCYFMIIISLFRDTELSRYFMMIILLFCDDFLIFGENYLVILW